MSTAQKDKVVGSKKIRLLDITLIIAVIVCLIIALYNYSGYSYSYYTDSITTVGDYAPQKPWMDFNINFTSTVFAAQNDIQVSIIATFDPEFQQQNPNNVTNAGSKFYFYMQGAVPSTRQYDKFGGEITSVIILNQQTDRSYRNASQTIRYEYEGDKCFTGGFSPIQNVLSLCDLTTQQPLIHISSADSLFQLQTQHVTLALTWAFGAFTVISIRDFAIGVGNNLTALRRKKETNDDAKSKKDQSASNKS